MASEGASIESKEWTLDPETEYRFELDPGTSLAVKVRSETLRPPHFAVTSPEQLIRGHAEVFGAELAANKPYLFGSECKAAIFTWRGCTIEMSTHHANPLSFHLTAGEDTSLANRRLNMFRRKRRWLRTQIYISRLNKCGSVP